MEKSIKIKRRIHFVAKKQKKDLTRLAVLDFFPCPNNIN